MINIKKLIAGFLVLAIGVSSFIFILSYYSTQKNKVTENVNKSQQIITNNIYSNQTTTIDTPGNITNALVNVTLTNLIYSNFNSNSSTTIKIPDSNKLISDITNIDSVKNISAPNWDAEADAYKINTVQDSTNTINTYLLTLNNTIQKNFISNNIENIIDNQTSTINNDVLLLIKSSEQDILKDVSSVETPNTFANFQNYLIKLLVYNKNSIQFVLDNENDPVKGYIIYNAENQKINDNLSLIDKEISKILKNKNLTLFYKKPTTNNNVQFIASLLGIKTANAQFATIDSAAILNSIKQYLEQQAKEFPKDLAHSLLDRARLLALQALQNQVLKWVNKGTNNAPQFIRSWADTFANAGTAAAIGALNSISPNICPAFAPLISASFNMTGGSGGSGIQQACTITADQMNNFAQDFSNGGFDMYVDLFKPDHNFYSTYFDTADAISTAAANAQNVAEIKAIAGQGFTGTQVCDDKSDPNGSRTVCVNNLGIKLNPLKNGSCRPDETAVTIPNGGLCADGSEPLVTTPGQITAQLTGKALGSSFDYLINVNSDNSSLAQTLANTISNLALSKIMTSVNGLLNKPSAGTPVNPNTNQGNTAKQQISIDPPSQTIFVKNASDTSDVADMMAIGGNYDENGNPPTYLWTAPSSDNPTSQSQDPESSIEFKTSYEKPGIYNITVTTQGGNSLNGSAKITVVPTSDQISNEIDLIAKEYLSLPHALTPTADFDRQKNMLDLIANIKTQILPSLTDTPIDFQQLTQFLSAFHTTNSPDNTEQYNYLMNNLKTFFGV